jgi:hypothetical protein
VKPQVCSELMGDSSRALWFLLCYEPFCRPSMPCSHCKEAAFLFPPLTPLRFPVPADALDGERRLIAACLQRAAQAELARPAAGEAEEVEELTRTKRHLVVLLRWSYDKGLEANHACQTRSSSRKRGTGNRVRRLKKTDPGNDQGE